MIADSGALASPLGGRRQRKPVAVAISAVVVASLLCATLGFLPSALFLVSLAVSWMLAPRVAAWARKQGATVQPGGRAIHRSPTPLLGGLAIFVPLCAALLAAGGERALGFALGLSLMAAAGAIDDVWGLSPRWKILSQAGAACMLFGSGYGIPAVLLPPVGAVATGPLELPLLVFWVILVTNAVNLIDGLDGLATGTTLVGALACAFLGLEPFFAIVLAGACLGFLRHNLPRASIFLGDTGSLMLGFALAALPLADPAGLSLPVAAGVLALPLGDVALSAVRRWLRGKPIFTADKGHVHHHLMRILGGPQRALAALLVFGALHAGLALAMPRLTGLLAIAGLWLLLVALLAVTARSGWSRILLDRRRFRRAHLARRYADEALRLSESREEVASILERVAADFELSMLQVRDLTVRRPSAAEGIPVEEVVDCGATSARWSHADAREHTVFLEEKRAILCELLRLADQRIEAFDAETADPPPARPPEPIRETGFALRLPRVHYVAAGRGDLIALEPVLRETRRRGKLEPTIVHTGRRDDLFDGRIPRVGLLLPEVDLDVPACRDALHTARIMERYEALLEAGEPQLVVVLGDSNSAVACALVAKKRAIPVAYVDAGERPAPGPVNRSLAESLADVRLTQDPPSDVRRQLSLTDDLGGDGRAGRIVPAIEELLDNRP